ncbi:MAG: hypothetical protein IKN27_01700 [Selenomonadaceae bacterium]|nr:hypothetical protein [Selenomonadaceae bacterium]
MKRPIKLRRKHPFGYAECAVCHEDVTQLVGYDVDGKEIYDGDKVISEYGYEVVARLIDNLPPKCKLKEDSDETTD